MRIRNTAYVPGVVSTVLIFSHLPFFGSKRQSRMTVGSFLFEYKIVGSIPNADNSRYIGFNNTCFLGSDFR